MKAIEFIGVGEAFQPGVGNTSILIHSDSRLLVDCGYGVPAKLFEQGYDCNFIDAIYLTHFHADHCFGLPPLLTAWWEEKREKPLTIIGQEGTEERVIQLLDLAYPSIRERLQYPLEFVESSSTAEFRELQLSFAPTLHGVDNYAVKVLAGEVSIGISGDGALTAESRELFADCKYLIHEAFMLEETVGGHTSAKEVVEFAASLSSLELLALVHIQRRERAAKLESFLDLASQLSCTLIVPEAGERIEIIAD